MIQTRDLHKIYGEGDAAIPAVRGISLAVDPGEFLAIMGPSGCGKSTLLHLLGALDTPSRGQIVLGNRVLSELDDDERTAVRRREIGFIFQAFNLVPVLSAEENVVLPLVIAGQHPDTYRHRLAEFLTTVGLDARRNLLPSQLSGGERQRVAIARALIHEPAVILADEPTGSLDQATGRDIMRLLRRLHETGQTIVLVTHDPNVASFADRILLMRDGELVDEVSVRATGDTTAVIARIAGFADSD